MFCFCFGWWVAVIVVVCRLFGVNSVGTLYSLILLFVLIIVG